VIRRLWSSGLWYHVVLWADRNFSDELLPPSLGLKMKYPPAELQCHNSDDYSIKRRSISPHKSNHPPNNFKLLPHIFHTVSSNAVIKIVSSVTQLLQITVLSNLSSCIEWKPWEDINSISNPEMCCLLLDQRCIVICTRALHQHFPELVQSSPVSFIH
jgi:hypothetical protein